MRINTEGKAEKNICVIHINIENLEGESLFCGVSSPVACRRSAELSAVLRFPGGFKINKTLFLPINDSRLATRTVLTRDGKSILLLIDVFEWARYALTHTHTHTCTHIYSSCAHPLRPRLKAEGTVSCLSSHTQE